MITKKKYLLKFVTIIGLSIIVLSIIDYSFSREDIRVPERNESVIKELQLNPIQVIDLLRDSIVNFGIKFLGTPYVEGSSNENGFDCSGFVFFVFKHFEIHTPRSSSQFMNFGKEIPIDSVRKGDILIFLSPTSNAIGHVGIVTNPKGKESDFIHASSGREMKVIISSLKHKGYKRRLVKAIDVL